ncbi:MAG: NAD(P)/FAD-dependent oxidoreductase [Acidobacteriota bacterium]|nr:NAD(P)/FAD-dependent oxidoreductase [Acidobacteriota bacterium]
MADSHRVVILGGGFGGLYAAKALGKLPVQLTVVDRRNFHLFQPLLYQVATGALSPGEIASPLRSVLSRNQNTRVLLGEATDVDVEQRRVKLDIGEVEYDTLIVATGSRNFYFGNDAWEANAPGLKTIEEATQIRHKILYAFEAAEREPDPTKRREWLTFVVVGAGPTGCELAGALGEIARDTLKNDFRAIRPEEARILLLEGAPRVLTSFPADLSQKAERSLIRIGVRTRTNVRVTAIDEQGVTLNGSERILARTVIWAAGVRASSLGAPLAKAIGAVLDKGGRIPVNADCSVPGHPEIFVIGDLASFQQDGKPLPGVAQVAMQQGGYVAKLIGKRLKDPGSARDQKPFRYFDKGNLAVLGRAAAVGQIGPVHVSGLFAWLIWLFIHLMYLVEFSNRLLVFVHWGYLYVTFNRGARLITGKGSE